MPKINTTKRVVSNKILNKLISVWFLMILSCIMGQLTVAEDIKIDDIRIEGLQRVSPSTVFAELPVRVGDTVPESVAGTIIRRLFKTGLFANVRVLTVDNVLTIRVVERAAISSIELDGNKALKTEDLLSSLADNGLSEGQIFEPATLEGMKGALLREYVAQGHYAATIDTDVAELPRNRVAVTINIDEGKKTAIKRIHIVGNTKFSDKKLLGLFESQTTNYLSWFDNKDKYSREKLAGDLERLASYYLDKGYLKFAIESTQVSISPDKRAIYITVNVNEGDIYNVGKVDLLGDLVLPRAQLEAFLFIKEGDRYNQAAINTIKEWIINYHANSGYTFAEVDVITDAHDDKPAEVEEANGDTITITMPGDKRVVDLTFFVTPKKRTYVRRIEFRGNTTTTDEVLRREMRQMESAPASNQKIEIGKIRLNRLGFFEEVDFETTPVPGTEDQVDVVYDIIEKSTGSINGSIGFSQVSGLILSANLSQNNFLGTGNSAGLNISRSQFQTAAGVSFNNPYFTPDGVSSGFNISFRRSNFEELNILAFSTDAINLGVNFGYPLSEISRINWGFGYENLDLTTVGNEPEEITSLDAFGDRFNNYSVLIGWGQSALNRGILPTGGFSQQLGVEITVPGSDLTFFRVNYSGQLFVPLFYDFVMRFRTKLGYGDSYGDLERLPFFKNYFAGGFGSIRGFETSTLGPRSTPAFLPANSVAVDENGNVLLDENGSGIPVPSFAAGAAEPIGGNVLLTASAEILLPIPFLKNNSSVQASLFFDAGNVFDTNCTELPPTTLVNGALVPVRRQENCSQPAFDELRYSAGLAVTWLSGFGPLSFSVGRTFNTAEFISNGLFAVRQEEDEFFQFSLGQTF